jgi:hypothetical protein
MLTFFTTAKPFRGHDGIIQRNALKSWTLLHPDVEVILFGDEQGAAEVCAELGLRHEPYVERDGRIPYVNFMFARAQQIARHDYLCYSNCDIILFKDFLSALEKALGWQKRFLMVAQRWDIDVTERLNFSSDDWAKKLRQFSRTRGFPQHPNFIDLFLFSRGLYENIPPLVVGHCYWDHWMVWKALSSKAPVLDASPFVMPLHQNHGYSLESKRKKGSTSDAGSLRNFELSQNGKHLRSIQDSTHRITRQGKIRRTRFRRLLESAPVWNVRQVFAEKTYPLRKKLGLRRRDLDEIG